MPLDKLLVYFEQFLERLSHQLTTHLLWAYKIYILRFEFKGIHFNSSMEGLVRAHVRGIK